LNPIFAERQHKLNIIAEIKQRTRRNSRTTRFFILSYLFSEHKPQNRRYCVEYKWPEKRSLIKIGEVKYLICLFTVRRGEEKRRGNKIIIKKIDRNEN